MKFIGITLYCTHCRPPLDLNCGYLLLGEAQVGNKLCEDSLNNEMCGFDGGDCCLDQFDYPISDSFCTYCFCFGVEIFYNLTHDDGFLDDLYDDFWANFDFWSYLT